MRSWILGVTLLLCIGVPSGSEAALISKGEYTLDTQTNLEWLSPALTAGFSYNAVSSGEGGWTTSGWRFATIREFATLAENNVGAVNSSDGFYQALGSSYFSAAQNLVLTFGPNLSFNYPSPYDITSIPDFEQILVQGYILGDGSNVGLGDIVARSRNKGIDGLPDVPLGAWGYFDSGFESRSGPYIASFLVKGVPEPSTWVMLLLGFAGLGVMTFRRKTMIASPAASPPTYAVLARTTLAFLIIVAALGGTPASASVALLTDRSQAGSDVISWGQLSPKFSIYSATFTVVSNGGITAYVGAGGTQKRLDEISGEPLFPGGVSTVNGGWAGNFSQGDQLLFNESGIGIHFSSPVSSVGAQFQQLQQSNFLARIAAFDTSGQFLGSFLENGSSNNNNDGSAIFIGISSSSANIADVVFGEYFNNLQFAINRISLSGDVPEPSTWAMMLIGFAGLGFIAYRKAKLQPLTA